MNRIAMIDWLIDSNNADMDIIEATDFVTHITNIMLIKQVEERDYKYVINFSDFHDICEVYWQIFKRELSYEKWEKAFMNKFTICKDTIITEFIEGKKNHEQLINYLTKEFNKYKRHKED